MTDERYTAFVRSLDYLGCNKIEGAIVELGVHRGESLRQLVLASVPHEIKRKVFGYDSWQGLPEPSSCDSQQFARGQLCASIEEVRNTLGVIKGVELVPGWFKDQEPIQERVALVHLDCDLYESARDALDIVTGEFYGVRDGAIVMIDDYYCHRARPDLGVRRAFDEWLEETGRSATWFWRYGWHGSAFVVHEGGGE